MRHERLNKQEEGGYLKLARSFVPAYYRNVDALCIPCHCNAVAQLVAAASDSAMDSAHPFPSAFAVGSSCICIISKICPRHIFMRAGFNRGPGVRFTGASSDLSRHEPATQEELEDDAARI